MSSSQALAIRERSVLVAREMKLKDHLGPAAQVEFLLESFNRVTEEILKFEDQFYGPLLAWGKEEKGFKLEEIKKIAQYAEKQVKTNALLGRGLRLKNNHAFGRGFRIEPLEGEGVIPPRFQKIIDDPDNQEVLFSSTAMKKNNRILFNSGNLFVIFDSKTKKFSRAAIDMHIKNYIAYQDDPERVKYYLHSYTEVDEVNGGMPEEVKHWIPVSTYKDALLAEKKDLPKSMPIGGANSERVEVSQTKVVVDLRVNNDSGEIWGTPDCLSALPWAWASSEYLRDGSKLLKALATIAYQIKAKSDAAQNRAGAQVSRARVAGTAITGTDTEISALPRANAVDLYTGRPLQAQVAAALDVSVTSLTGDTAKGGSNGAESTLSLPEQLAALSRQEDFSGFMVRAFRAMGAQDLRLNFNRLAVDPIHRQAQTAGLLRTLGGISQKELRRISLELLDINGDVDDLPEPDEFTGSKYSTLADQVDAGLENDEQNQTDPNASQGNSGAVGSVTDDNELRSTDASGSE